jgi:Fic family protein
LCQDLKKPTLSALSQAIKDHKKEYYTALKKQNKDNHIIQWLIYFAQTILQAQKYTLAQMGFIIKKTQFLIQLKITLISVNTKLSHAYCKRESMVLKAG